MKAASLNIRTLFILLSLSVVSFAATSQNVGVWTLNNTLAGTGTPFNTVGNVSLGSAIGSGSFNGSTEYYGENGWPSGGINTNAYVQFTITPILSYQLSMNTIDIRMRRSNTGSPSGSGPTAWAVRSSLDGFTTNIATGTMTHNYANYIVSLPAFAYLTAIVTFRIYGYSATVSSGGNSRLVLDNISLQGGTGTLPVSFPSFVVKKAAAGNELKWKLENISAGTKISAERSINGTDFFTIYNVDETNNSAQKEYRFVDEEPRSANTYYRIKAVDVSGSVHRSQIVLVNNRASSIPVINKIATSSTAVNAWIEVPSKGIYTIAIFGAGGNMLLKKEYSLEAGANSINLPMRNSSTGIFVLSVYKEAMICSKQFRF